MSEPAKKKLLDTERFLTAAAVASPEDTEMKDALSHKAGKRRKAPSDDKGNEDAQSNGVAKKAMKESPAFTRSATTVVAAASAAPAETAGPPAPLSSFSLHDEEEERKNSAPIVPPSHGNNSSPQPAGACVGPPSPAPVDSRSYYLSLKKPALRQLCQDRRLAVSGTKMQLIDRLENSHAAPIKRQDGNDGRLRELFSAAQVENTLKTFKSIAQDVYPAVAAGASSGSVSSKGAAAQNRVQKLLADLGVQMVQVKEKRIVITVHGVVGSAKSYYFNSVLMEGTVGMLLAGRCAPHSPCQGNVLCCGHGGPLPSLEQPVSLTTLPTRITYDKELSVCVKDGDDIQRTLPLVGFSVANMHSIRKFIHEAASDEETSKLPNPSVEVRGPFPGLDALAHRVRELLPEKDRSLFNGIELLDLPGEGDSSFPQSRRRTLMASCDVVLLRPRGKGGRLITPSEIISAIEAGALPSFVQRPTLAFLWNLEQDGGANGRSISELNESALEHFRAQFRCLMPALEQMTIGAAAAPATQPAAAVAASSAAAVVESTPNAELVELRKKLAAVLSDSCAVRVQSASEGDALFEKAGNEAGVVLFSSSQYSGCLSSASVEFAAANRDQLATIIVQELVQKLKISRIFPLLDLLQKVGNLIKQRVAQFVYSKAPPARQPRAVLTPAQVLQHKKAGAHVRPVLDFTLRGNDLAVMDHSGLVDELLRVLDARAAAGATPAVVFEALRKHVQKSSTINVLRSHMRALCLDAFEPVLEDLDKVIDDSIRQSTLVAAEERPAFGFHGVMLRARLNECHGQLLAEELSDTIIAQECGKVFKVKLSDPNEKRLLTLWQEMDAKDSDSMASDEEEPESEKPADEEEEEEKKGEEVAAASAESVAIGLFPLPVDVKARRQRVELLLRLLFDRVLSWQRVNAGNRKGKCPTRDALFRIVDDLWHEAEVGLEQQFAALVSDGPEQAAVAAAAAPHPLLSKEAAKAKADEIEAGVRLIRKAMREFNPSFGPPEPEQELLSDDPFPIPKQFWPEKCRSVIDELRPPTAQNFAAMRYKKGAFKLSAVVSRLGIIPTRCVRCMKAMKILPAAGHPKESELPADRLEHSQRMAAALVKAAYAKLGVKLPADQSRMLNAVTDADVAGVEQLVWPLRPSSIRCEIAAIEPVDPAAAVDVVDDDGSQEHATTAQHVSYFRRKGNKIIEVQRYVDEKKFVAAIPKDLLQGIVARVQDRAPALVAPIFIPSKRCGVDASTGNLFLDAFPQDSDRQEDAQPLGMEESVTHIFVLVEPRNLWRFMQTFGVGSTAAAKHPSTYFTWVLLPVNFAFFGMAVTVGKLLAEALNFPTYWSIDDDLKFIEQYETPGRWFKASFRRCLLFGQQVLETALDEQYTMIDSGIADAIVSPAKEYVDSALEDKLESMPREARIQARKELGLFKDCMAYAVNTAKDLYSHNHDFNKNPRPLLERALIDKPVDKYGTFGSLQQRFPNLPLEVINRAWDMVVEKVKELGRLKADCIADVSIAHSAGRKSGYVHKERDANYREAVQRYQMVLHNTDATRGYNMVPDTTLMAEKPWHTIRNDVLPPRYWAAFNDWRHDKLSGCKGPDRPYTRALKSLGKIGFQIFNFVHERLRFPDELDKKAWITTDDESLACSDASEGGEDDE